MSKIMIEKVAYENGHIVTLKELQSILKIPVSEEYLNSIGYKPDSIGYKGNTGDIWWYSFRLPDIAMGIAKAVLRESYSRRKL